LTLLTGKDSVVFFVFQETLQSMLEENTQAKSLFITNLPLKNALENPAVGLRLKLMLG
jgi:hypothetical protein